MSLLPVIEDDLAAILHPIDALVDKKVAELKADAEAEKVRLSTDVKNAIAKAKADAVAATPGLEAAAEKAFDDALAAAVTALKVYGV
jgi:hypothetical protein